MRGYFSILNCSMQMTIAYRSTYYVGVVTNILYFLFLFFLWDAIFHNSDNEGIIAGYTWTEMKAYLLITFVINTEVYSEHRLAAKILNGSLSTELIKPIHFQEATLFHTFGSIILGLFLNIILVVICIVYTDVNSPATWTTWIAFGFSVVFGIIIKYFIVFISSLFAFWTQQVTGLYWARTAISNLFSGALIPLTFFSGWLQEVADYLPFKSIITSPVNIYLEKYSSYEALVQLGFQLIWILLLWFFGRILFNYGVRKVVINGG